MTSQLQTESIGNPTKIEPFIHGARVDAVNVSRRVGRRQILQDMSLSIEPGELVAIAGGSGAGKTTLLEILAGLQPPSAGEVRHAPPPPPASTPGFGHVPQDDIIHLEMPLRRTLRYAARPTAARRHIGGRGGPGGRGDDAPTSTWPIEPRYRSARCPGASASGPASQWSY